MATEVSSEPVAPGRRRRTRKGLSYNAKWAIGVAIAAVVVFLAYYYVIPNLNDNARTFFRNWLPLVSINEALVWATCALGLNVVVGYAGLLDLGYVGFFAIGTYTVALLTSQDSSWVLSAKIRMISAKPSVTMAR